MNDEDVDNDNEARGGGGVATTTGGSGFLVFIGCKYAVGGADAEDDPLGDLRIPFAPLDISSVEPPRPFSLSDEPPSVNLDIIRCSFPERLFDESSEIMLAFIPGGFSSTGGPSSRKSMRSRAVFEM